MKNVKRALGTVALLAISGAAMAADGTVGTDAWSICIGFMGWEACFHWY